MNKKQQQQISSQRVRRANKVRSRISGTAKKPRLAVYRTLRYISAQLIDDTNSKTLVSAHQKQVAEKLTKTEAAAKVGQMIAEKAKSAGIETIVFDRRYYNYHGRVKALADAAREHGLKF